MQKYSLRPKQRKKPSYTNNLLKSMGANIKTVGQGQTDYFIIEANDDMVHKLKAKGYSLAMIVPKK